jgi:hypothetical protein
MSEGDASLAEIIGRHLDVDAIADADADEILAHFARNMGQHFVPVGQRDTKHGSRQHLCHNARQFDWFFFSQAILQLKVSVVSSLVHAQGATHFMARDNALTPPQNQATFGGKIWGKF